MNRADLLALETDRAARATQPLELRVGDDPSGETHVVGYASITGTPYQMYGGPPYGWDEIVNPGSFGKTLSESPKVDFLFQHDGMPLASTVARTYRLTLAEDETGLHSDARINPDEPDARALMDKMSDGRLTEMSFAFRIMRQRWEDEDGNEADPMTAPVRRIMEVNIHRGDTSVVRNGANPHTWSTLRELDDAMACLRAGDRLSDAQKAIVRQFIGGTEPEIERETPAGMSLARARLLAA